MYYKEITRRLAVLACALFVANGASAATAFSDNFDRKNGSKVGNGWSEVERKAGKVRIKNAKMRLKSNIRGRGADAAAATSVINTTGNDRLTASFNWKALRKNEKSDKLRLVYTTDRNADLSDRAAWKTIFKGSSRGKKGKKFSERIALDLQGNTSGVRFMLLSDVSEGKKGRREGFVLDEFNVIGSNNSELTQAISPVPIPASLSLLAVGLGGLGFMARRKRKAA